MIDWNNTNIKGINVEAPEYLEAIEIAQSNLDIFISIFSIRENKSLQFSIKKKFEENGQIEHMWATPISYDAGRFTAILDNVPGKITTLKEDDVIDIDRAEIEDWIIVEDGIELLGNFILHSML